MWTNKEFTDFWTGAPYCETDIEIPDKPVGTFVKFDKENLIWVEDKKVIDEYCF